MNTLYSEMESRSSGQRCFLRGNIDIFRDEMTTGMICSFTATKMFWNGIFNTNGVAA